MQDIFKETEERKVENSKNFLTSSTFSSSHSDVRRRLMIDKRMKKNVNFESQKKVIEG